jgi:uncharacterized peroxidase-related enzyme
VESHAEFLRLITLDREFAQALRRDWRSLDLSAADRAMLAYAEMITKDPRQVQPETLDGLRAAGFTDVAILQVTMIAAWFNYINRMADALGVGRGEP